MLIVNFEGQVINYKDFCRDRKVIFEGKWPTLRSSIAIS